MGQRSRAFIVTWSAAGLVGLVWTEWGTGRVGDDSMSFRGWDIPVFRWLVLVAAGGMMIAGAVMMWRRTTPGRVIMACELVVLVLSMSLTVLVESIGELLPLDLLPDTLRRSAFEVGAGGGVWAGVLLSAVGAAACSATMIDALRTLLRRLAALAALFVGVEHEFIEIANPA